jgi:hypothetical protein
MQNRWSVANDCEQVFICLCAIEPKRGRIQNSFLPASVERAHGRRLRCRRAPPSDTNRGRVATIDIQ